MKDRCKKFLRNEKGSVLPLVSLSIVALLSMSALIIDLGGLFVTKTHLKKAANASALSAGQELVTSTTAVETIIDQILDAHNESDSLLERSIDLGSSVRVSLRREVPLTFAKLLGFDRVTVEAASAAQILSMGRAKGAAPVGIDEAFPLEYGIQYSLKVDQTEVDAGNFGVLALAGPGAQTYEDNLRNGYGGEIKVGDVIETQTGNIAGKTRTVINDKVNACPYTVGDIDHRDCPRILLVPVYHPYYYTTNQLKSVKIVGFAYFYILEPMSANDTSITGMYLNFLV